jgi:hypothetical protein
MALALDRRSIKDLLYCVDGLGRFEHFGEDENNPEQGYIKGVDCISTRVPDRFCVDSTQKTKKFSESKIL